MKKVLSIMLSLTILFTLNQGFKTSVFAIDESGVPTTANGEILNMALADGDGTGQTYQNSANLIGSSNLVLRYGYYGYKNLLMIDNRDQSAYLLYKFNVTAPIDILSAYIKGRLYGSVATPGKIRFLVSTSVDGPYTDANGINSTVASNNSEIFLESYQETKVNIANPVISGQTTFYVKVELTTSLNWTDGAAINSIRLVSTNNTPVIASGTVLDVTGAEGSWNGSSNLVDSYNVKSGSVDIGSTFNFVGIDNPQSPNYGSLTYKFNLDAAASGMQVFVNGRVASYGLACGLKFLVSTSPGGNYTEISNLTFGDYNFFWPNTTQTVDCSSAISGKKEIYLKIEFTSNGDNRACISALKVVTTRDNSNTAAKSNGVIMNETFDSSNWFNMNDSVYSVNNLTGGTQLDNVNTSILTVIPNTSTTVGTMVFRLKTDKPMSVMTLEYTGRTISNDPLKYSYVEFLISTDNINYVSIGKEQGNNLNAESAFLSAPGRSKQSFKEVNGKSDIYLKVAINTVSETWGCLDSLKVITQEKKTVATVSNGTVMNEPFDTSNWATSNAKLIALDNLTGGNALDIYNVVNPTSSSKEGYMIFEVNAAKPMENMGLSYTGRTISNDSSRFSYVEFFVAGSDMNFTSVGKEQGNGLTAEFGFLDTPRTKDISSNVLGKTKLYIKVVIYSVDSDWGSLNNLTFTSTDFVPVTFNSVTAANGEISGIALGSNLSASSIIDRMSAKNNDVIIALLEGGNPLNLGDMTGTGAKLRVSYYGFVDEYTMIISGDVDGDGDISVLDLAKIKMHLLKMEQLSGIYLKAADIQNSGFITISDLIGIKKALLNL